MSMKKTNVPGSQSFGQKLLQFIRNNTVPIMFILICAYYSAGGLFLVLPLE